MLTLVVAVLLMLGATGLLISKNMGAGAHAEVGQQAKYSAAAGLRYALAQLSEDPFWQPSGLFTGNLPDIDPSLGYEVEILNNFGGTTAATRSDGGVVPPRQVWMHAYGTRDGKRIAGNYGIAEKIAVKPDVIFEYALFETRSGCNPKETFIRSYSSDPDEPADFVWGGTPRKDAKLRANASFGFGPDPPAWVDGSVTIPSASAFNGGSMDFTDGLVYDPITPLRLKFRIPVWPVNLRAAAASPPPASLILPPGRYTDLVVPAGSVARLTNGVYVFDSITIAGEATPGDPVGALQLDPFSPPVPPSTTSACVVYVRNSFVLGNKALVNTEPLAPATAPRPRDFQLYTTDEGVSGASSGNFGPRNTPVELGSDSVFTGTIAGHGAVVVMATDSLLRGGMTVGRQIWGSRARIEYDRTLRDQRLDGDSEWVLTGEGDD